MSIPALPVASQASFSPRASFAPPRAAQNGVQGPARVAQNPAQAASTNASTSGRSASALPPQRAVAPAGSADGNVGVRGAGVPPGAAPSAGEARQSRDGAAPPGAGPRPEAGASAGAYGFTRAEIAQLRALRKRDAEVRAHEQAHAAVGGAYAGAPTYQYQRGPDGRQYAVGGSVSIDASPIPGDPAATIRKMRIVRSAALAPAQPSQADRQVAAQASREIALAQAELAKQAASDRVAELRVRTAPGADQPPADDAQGAEATASATEARRARAVEAYQRIDGLGAGGVPQAQRAA